MNEKRLRQILPFLIKQVKKYREKRTFFWPNQSRSWLDFTSKQIDLSQRESSQILVIGGVLYSCYLSAKGYSTIAIEKDPMAAIAQLYICWLIDQGASLEDVNKAFLLHLVGKRTRAHQREEISVPKKEHFAALHQFKKFPLIKNDRVSTRIFDRMLRITKDQEAKKQLFLIKKGIGLIGFGNAKFKLPEQIIIADIRHCSPKKLGRFDLIITTNVIDFFSAPEEFFFTIFPFLKRDGILEITIYNQETKKRLQEVFTDLNKKQYAGKARLLRKLAPKKYQEFNKKLMLGDDLFFIKKEIIRKKMILLMPYWIKELLVKGRFRVNYQLFRKKSWYFVANEGKLKEVVRKK